MLNYFSDLKGPWERFHSDSESMLTITFESLKYLISNYAGKSIPETVAQDLRVSLKEILDEVGEAGQLSEGLQERLYCLVYVLNMASGLAYDDGVSALTKFLDLREQLSPAANMRLMNSEASLVNGLFDKAKKEVDIDAIKQYLKDSGEYGKRLEELKHLHARVNHLEENLKKHEVAYNFVGLYKGFHTMREEKQRELDKQNNLVIGLGVAAVVPLVVKLLDSLFFGGDKINIPLLITIGGLELILIYFFRIALHSANSIKAQLLQIDLRRTLCSFIQDYAEYSKKIKESNPAALDKFETLIFSGLVMQDDKLPSTFDGLEPIQKILERRN